MEINIKILKCLNCEKEVWERHPSWKNGYNARYGIGKKRWTELSKKIKIRDNFTCQICKKQFDENKNFSREGLVTHHIIPFIISKDNSEKNLITICRYCHRRLHGLNVPIKSGEGNKNRKKLEKAIQKRNQKNKKKRKDYRKKHHKKNNAGELGRKHIKIPKGQLCEICKKELAIERHHKDYNKPLKVMFVCRKCHYYLNRNKKVQKCN